MSDRGGSGSRVPWGVLRVLVAGIVLALLAFWLGVAVVRLTDGRPCRALFDLAVALVLGAWLMLLGLGTRLPTLEPDGGATVVRSTKATAARSAAVSSAMPLLLAVSPIANRTTAEPGVLGRVVGALWITVTLLGIRFYRLDRSRTVTIPDGVLRMTNPDLLRPGRVIERSRRMEDIESARKQRLMDPLHPPALCSRCAPSEPADVARCPPYGLRRPHHCASA